MDGTSILYVEWTISLSIFAWGLDGRFKKESLTKSATFCWDRDDNNILAINKLFLYPFTSAVPERRDSLKRRGMMFWACRAIRHIQYSGWDIAHREHFVRLGNTRCIFKLQLMLELMLDSRKVHGR